MRFAERLEIFREVLHDYASPEMTREMNNQARWAWERHLRERYPNVTDLALVVMSWFWLHVLSRGNQLEMVIFLITGKEPVWWDEQRARDAEDRAYEEWS